MGDKGREDQYERGYNLGDRICIGGLTGLGGLSVEHPEYVRCKRGEHLIIRYGMKINGD